MQELNSEEINEANGGVMLNAKVTIALLSMSETWGPIGLAFAGGYTAGTWLYDNYLREKFFG